MTHQLAIPFLRENTAQWRERDRIRKALANIRDAADEAYVCLDKVDRTERDITQASTAIVDLEQAFARLKFPIDSDNPHPKGAKV